MRHLISPSILCAAVFVWGCSSEAGSSTTGSPSGAPTDPGGGSEQAPSNNPGATGEPTAPESDPVVNDTAAPTGLVDPSTATASRGSRSRRLALGWSHACATNQAGEAVCGGWDWSQPAVTPECEIGNGIEGSFTPPVAQLAYVDGEAYATCGIERDTQVLKCWGDHYVSDALTDLPGVVQVTVSVSQACALTTDDRVLCNGPRLVEEFSGLSAIEIAMGHDHICALLADGQIKCQHTGGEDRDFGQSNVPEGSYKFLAAGRSTTCAIDMSNELHCWGLNDQGQATPPSGKYTWVDVGPSHGCGLLESDALVCWGANDNSESTPPAGSFAEVAVGYGFSCGLTLDSIVQCWGVPYCANTALPSAL